MDIRALHGRAARGRCTPCIPYGACACHEVWHSGRGQFLRLLIIQKTRNGKCSHHFQLSKCSAGTRSGTITGKKNNDDESFSRNSLCTATGRADMELATWSGDVPPRRRAARA